MAFLFEEWHITMINPIAQAWKAQEVQDMKATRHKMHMSMLGLKHLKQGRDEEHKRTWGMRHEQYENMQGARHVR